jgi:hypothetical protein
VSIKLQTILMPEAIDFHQLSNEFKFPIASFHHAGETYLVPDLLKQTWVSPSQCASSSSYLHIVNLLSIGWCSINCTIRNKCQVMHKLCTAFWLLSHQTHSSLQEETRSLSKFRVRNACTCRPWYSRCDEGRTFVHLISYSCRSPPLVTPVQSDHPVVNSRYLLNEAAMAHFYGLDPALALASVTSTPADALGLGHRVGTIREGVTFVELVKSIF